MVPFSLYLAHDWMNWMDLQIFQTTTWNDSPAFSKARRKSSNAILQWYRPVVLNLATLPIPSIPYAYGCIPGNLPTDRNPSHLKSAPSWPQNVLSLSLVSWKSFGTKLEADEAHVHVVVQAEAQDVLGCMSCSGVHLRNPNTNLRLQLRIRSRRLQHSYYRSTRRCA